MKAVTLKKREYYDYNRELYNIVDVKGYYITTTDQYMLFRPEQYESEREDWLWEVNKNFEIVGNLIKPVPTVVEITTKCIECGKVETLYVLEDDIEKYNLGLLNIQDAFPYISPAEREFHFISKICGKCWDSMFGDEDELD